jgi:hypothetical protein
MTKRKSINIWKLKDIHLSNPRIKRIKEGKLYIEVNDNENTINQNS